MSESYVDPAVETIEAGLYAIDSLDFRVADDIAQGITESGYRLTKVESGRFVLDTRTVTVNSKDLKEE